MQAGQDFESQFRQRMRAPLRRSLTITDAGLMLGRGTCLPPNEPGASPSGLALAGNEERTFALLAIACGKSVPVEVIGHLRRASEQWARGDKCLAHIHIAFADVPQISEADAARLALADEALAKGASPRALLRAIGLDSAALDALKFNFSQPRVPAGNGAESGRWTSEGSSAIGGARIIPVSEIGREGEHPEGDPKDDLYQERSILGEESIDEDIKHGRPIDPLKAPIAPLAAPPSRSVLMGNNAAPSGRNKYVSDLPGGLEEAKTLFESWTQGQTVTPHLNTENQKSVQRLRSEDGTQLRINADGSIRIDRPIDIDGRNEEKIHFKDRAESFNVN